MSVSETHITEKCMRLSTLLENKEESAVGESVDDTLYDLAGYCILTLVERQSSQNPK